MIHKKIRIGTRKSPLAIWQAELVQNALENQGFRTEIVGIKSEGDLDLVTPLYEMGVQGVFTKAADIALLNDQIDIAVHSLKDVPTLLPKGIVQAAAKIAPSQQAFSLNFSSRVLTLPLRFSTR